jgi:hypothetical protein
VVKQKWFQHSQRANIVSHWIIELTKTKQFIFIIGFIIGVIGMSLYDRYETELFLAKNQRIIDSLGVEISVKNRENEVLNKKANELDSLLEIQKDDVTNIINNFPEHQRPEIKNSDSAAKFIFDFIRK